MQATKGRKTIILAITLSAGALALAGCSPPLPDDQTNLMRLRSKDGPDEFAILPPKALEMPGNLSALPAPTPGGANRTDPRPFDDAIIALGGTPGAAGGVPSADAALAAHGSRFGTDPGVRGELAAADLEHRRKKPGRLFERLFGSNTYFSAYERESLNQQQEVEYWRSRGLLTPAAPPRSYDKAAEEKERREALAKDGR